MVRVPVCTSTAVPLNVALYFIELQNKTRASVCHAMFEYFLVPVKLARIEIKGKVFNMGF